MTTRTAKADPLTEIVLIGRDVRELCGNTLANEILDQVGRARQDRAELLALIENILPQAVKINGNESQWVRDARAAIAKAAV